MTKFFKKKSAAKDVKSREISAIQGEYKEACMALGDREYRIVVLQAEALQLKQRLQQLNQEASSLPTPKPEPVQNEPQ